MFTSPGQIDRFRLMDAARYSKSCYISILWVVTCISLLMGMVFQPGEWYSWWVLTPIVIGTLLVTLLSTIVSFMYRTRMAKRVIESRGKLCFYCGYDLRNRPVSDVVCPECGAAASTRQCVIYWCKLYRSRF